MNPLERLESNKDSFTKSENKIMKYIVTNSFMPKIGYDVSN